MEKLFQSMRALNASTDYEFSSVDRLFISKRLPVQKCIADVFKDEVHKMDFVIDPELARMYINNWVANQTNDHIKDLLPSSKISYNTRLVLVSNIRYSAVGSKHQLFNMKLGT
jgi:serpin B